MKKIILFMMIFCLALTETVQGQEKYKTITTEQITDPFWKSVSKVYWGYTKLPYIRSKSKTREYYRANQAYKRYPYKKALINSQLPLYASPDRNIADSKQTILAVFYHTNGDYFIAVVEALSGDHSSCKQLLITFGLDGKVLDFLTFYNYFESLPHHTHTTESRLNADLTVETNILELNDPYPINENFNVKSGLHGQRIDRKYQITPQGKFKLVSETKYQPKDYTAKELAGTTCIADGDEQPIK